MTQAFTTFNCWYAISIYAIVFEHIQTASIMKTHIGYLLIPTIFILLAWFGAWSINALTWSGTRWIDHMGAASGTSRAQNVRYGRFHHIWRDPKQLGAPLNSSQLPQTRDYAAGNFVGQLRTNCFAVSHETSPNHCRCFAFLYALHDVQLPADQS